MGWFLPPTSDNIMPLLIFALFPCFAEASLPLKTILDFPILIPSPSPNITTVLGSNADLSCRIRNVGNRTVSWLRYKDNKAEILTSGREVYSGDVRIKMRHTEGTEDFTLGITNVQLRDAGHYECQINAIPVISQIVHLTVIDPVTKILGPESQYIEEGQSLNLTCVILNSHQPPQFITWIKDEQMITLTSSDDRVRQITEKGSNTSSILLIMNTKLSDGGTYTCKPSVGQKASVSVRVIERVNQERQLELSNSVQLHSKVADILLTLIFVNLVAF